jgi:hypothetical protein
MIGISWGGFNGLQVAARRPPALKAMITLCSEKAIAKVPGAEPRVDKSAVCDGARECFS